MNIQNRLFKAPAKWPIFAGSAPGKNFLKAAGVCCIIYVFIYFLVVIATTVIMFPRVIFFGLGSMSIPFFYVLYSICSLIFGYMSIRWSTAFNRALALIIISVIYLGITVIAIYTSTAGFSPITYVLELVSIPVSILLFTGALINRIRYKKTKAEKIIVRNSD